VKYLFFKSVLHKEEAEISDMYVLRSTSGETDFGKSDHNCTIMKKWQCLFTNSYSLKNLISTTAEYPNLCHDGIKSPVHLGITVKYNDGTVKYNELHLMLQ